MKQLHHWARIFADLDDEKIWTVPLICRFAEKNGQSLGRSRVRAFIQRKLRALKISTVPDGTRPGDRAKGWYGWKLKMIIPNHSIPSELSALYQKEGRKRLRENGVTLQSSDQIRTTKGINLQWKSLLIHRWSLLLGLGFFAFVGFGAIFWSDPVNQIKWHESSEDLEWLREKINNKQWAPFRTLLVKSIASISSQDEPMVFNDDHDLKLQHIGTFAFKERPFVVFEQGLVRIGSWVQYNGFSGYVSDVKPGRLVLSKDQENVPIFLPRVRVFDRPEPWNYSVAINNGGWHVLSKLADVYGLQLPSMENVVIHGNFRVDSMQEFVARIGPDLGLSLDEDVLVFHKIDGPRAAIGFGDVLAWPISIDGLLKHWQAVGVDIIGPYDDEVRKKQMVFSPMQIGPTMKNLRNLGDFQYDIRQRGNMKQDDSPF